MALSGFGSSNYVGMDTALLSAGPLTMAGFCYFASSAQGTIIALNSSASTYVFNRYALGILSNGRVEATSNAGSGTPAPVQSSAAGSTNTWIHGAVVFSSSTSAYLNGANKGTGTLRAPASLNRTTVGAERASNIGNASPSGWMFAEIGVWNAALSDEEIGALAKGYSPSLIRPDNLVSYLPLVRDPVDLRGNQFAVTGSLSVANHPPVIVL
jgi:hypothetical protein